MAKAENKSEEKTVVNKKKLYFVPSQRRSVEADSADKVVEVLKSEEKSNKKKGSE